MAADGSMLAFQRAIKLAAEKTLVAQLPEQRHLQLERGLAEEDLLKSGSVIGILQAQSIVRPGGCGETRELAIGSPRTGRSRRALKCRSSLSANPRTSKVSNRIEISC